MILLHSRDFSGPFFAPNLRWLNKMHIGVKGGKPQNSTFLSVWGVSYARLKIYLEEIADRLYLARNSKELVRGINLRQKLKSRPIAYLRPH